MAGTGFVRVVDIRDGAVLRGNYLVRTKTLRMAKNGRPYLSLEFGDRTGAIEGRVWDDAERFAAACDVGDVVAVQARATSYQGKVQLHVNGIERLPREAIALEDFIPASGFPLDDMFAALRRVVEEVGDPWIRALLLSILDDPELGPALRVAPAAKGMHHAYLGGLVEHSLSMALVLLRLHDHYERLLPGVLDRDLLVAGAVLHDIGKITEISSGAGFEYTEEGRLVGHIVGGAELITARAAAIEGFPPELVLRLKHLVLAHHGRLEYGSPVTPRTAEAFLLHEADMIDARLNAMNTAFRGEAGSDWTGYNRMMESFLLNPFGAVSEDGEGQPILPHADPSWMEPDAAPEEEPDPEPTGRRGRPAARRGRPKAGADGSGDEGPGNLSLF